MKGYDTRERPDLSGPAEFLINRRRFLGAVGGFTALAALAACGADSQSAAGSTASTRLRVGIGADLSGTDPHFGSSSATDSAIMSNVYDGLVRRDPSTMKIGPYVAEKWDVTPDGLTYTFHLRKGIKFHTGGEMTSDDVIWSFNRIIKYPNSSLISQFEGIVKGVEAIDRYTVKFALNRPDATLLSKFETETGYLRIASKAAFDSAGEKAFENPGFSAGSGPYKLVEWQRGTKVTLRRNPDFFQGQAAIENVEFNYVPDEATRVSALLSGDLDIVGPLSPEQTDRVGSSGANEVKKAETTRRVFLGFNSEKGPFADVRVRQAASYAIDIDTIIKNVLSGNGTRIYSMVLPFEAGYTEEGVVKYNYDPGKAKQLLSEAGYDPAKSPIVITTTAGRYLKDLESAQAVAQYLKDAGFAVSVQDKEWAAYTEQTTGHKMTDMYLAGYGGGGSFDADTTLQGLFKSSNARTYFKNPDVDKVVDEGGSTIGDKARQQVYAGFNQIVTSNATHIPLWAQHDLWGVSSRVDWSPLRNESLYMFFAKAK